MFIHRCICLLFLIKCNHGYQPLWNHEYDHYHRQIPQEVMVDVVNNLALKLLAIHNENNENNIAISPYGVLTVLVALGEGVRGDAAHEIQHAAAIPKDLSTIRIGLRDIHRHLKSYFIPDEGFLSGLTLSHDNVTLNIEYEEVLQFYGFDINSFNSALYPDMYNTTPVTEDPLYKQQDDVTELSTTETERMFRSESTTLSMTSADTFGETTTIQMTTPQTESTTENAVTDGSTSTVTPSETMSPSTSTTKPIEITTSDEGIDNSITTIKTTSKREPSTTSMSRVTDTTTTAETITDATTEFTRVTIISTTQQPESVTVSTSIGMDMSTTVSKTETESSTIDVETTTPASTLQTDNEISKLESTTELFDTTTDNLAETTIIKRRSTRSVVDYVIARYYDDHTVTQKPPPPYNPTENELYFLVNGKYRESNISYMTYDTVLPFHYIPHLNTLALRFPLDSSKYYLLLLLPKDDQGIDKLICDLRLNGSLKYIVNGLRYTHVKAFIPSFMLKGYVVLTSTLQKMGIRKVFEPRQADFSAMTNDPGIYVTNIEQAITVAIRNYVDPNTLDNNRMLQHDNPVYFKADHPFLYFVIDSELHISLMGGKIVNPLNSRIR